MDKKNIFRYNPKKHNWSEVKRCLPIILIGTLILSALESTVASMVDDMFSPTSVQFTFLTMSFGVLNAFLLRKYHRILRYDGFWEKENPRLAAFAIVVIGTAIYILVFMSMIHAFKADVYHARTLDGLTFNEAEYFYIDNPGRIDTTRIGHDVKKHESYNHRTFATEITYTGYFVAPFCGQDSVFYVMSYSYEGATTPLSSGKRVWNSFEQLTEETRKDINPVVSSHLFQRINPGYDSYFWTAAGYSYSMDSVSHDMESIHRSVLLNPVEGDVMPHWTDNLRGLLGIFLLVFLLTSCFFVFSDTSTPSSSSLQRKKKKR